jgi:hypothetical protein
VRKLTSGGATLVEAANAVGIDKRTAQKLCSNGDEMV